ncbi:MAG: phage major capsid protein [Alteromonas sp.]|nr:phage major capsid protein [Alteromonas sp.]
MNIDKYLESQFSGKVKGLTKLAENIRTDKESPQDVTFDEVLKEKFDTTLESFLDDIGIDPMIDTISNIMSTPDDDVKWVVPELIRSAIRLGLRDAPIWPTITSSEQDISQKSITMPYINMSDAAPRKVNEGETIPLGSISYGDKSVKAFKIGRGIKITYEVRQYVSLDVISIFFQDFGIKLGQSLDTLAIDVLINGDQADGSASAPVIGVGTANSKEYKDLLKVWIRAGRLGRNLTTLIGGEEAALETLDMDEFKKRESGTTKANLNLRTPVPRNADYFVHGNVPADQEIMLDPRFALVKYNVQPLLIESDKIVSNQTEEFYASLTLGFGKLFRDAAVVLDKSVAFADNGFPAYMDKDPYQDVKIED